MVRASWLVEPLAEELGEPFGWDLPEALATSPAEPAGVADAGGGANRGGGNGHRGRGERAPSSRPVAAGLPARAPLDPAPPTAQIHWVGNYASVRQPADLFAELSSRATGLVIVDARYPEVFAREHLPGAINLPVPQIDAASTAEIDRGASIVVYCWNESCHASMKAAARFAALGFEVNELHGGLQAWKRQGYPTERG